MEEAWSVLGDQDQLYKEYTLLRDSFIKSRENSSKKNKLCSEEIKRKIDELSKDEREVLTRCVNPYNETLGRLLTDVLYKRILQHRHTFHRNRDRSKKHSALHEAVYNNCTNAVLILLAMGASPFIRVKSTDPLPIHWVCQLSLNPRIFKLLYWSMQTPDFKGNVFSRNDQDIMLAEVTKQYGNFLGYFNCNDKVKIERIHAFLIEHGESKAKKTEGEDIDEQSYLDFRGTIWG